jgi:hypothetical protein
MRMSEIYADVADINPRAVMGGNGPPAVIENIPQTSAAIDTARAVYRSLSVYLQNTPVIESHDEAKGAANLIEQGRRTIDEIETERKSITGILNKQVKDINDTYRGPREFVIKVVDEIKRRLTAFASAEEARREAEAAEARAKAEEAERIAREAERVEQEAKQLADVGECDVDVASAIVDADKAFAKYKKAERIAARTEDQIQVRLAGGFGRAVSMRKSETLIVEDAHKAIASMGLTDGIRDAILSSARAYRKLNGCLPAGVTAETERKF